MEIDGVKIQVLRVFVDERDEFGNPLGVVVDEEGKITVAERQAITKKLGFSEAVFVDEVRGGVVSIYFSPPGWIDLNTSGNVAHT